MGDKEIQGVIRRDSSLIDHQSSNVTNELNLKYCTGCSACAEVCSVSSITMQAAREGVPVSLSAAVISCGGGKLYTGFADMPEHVPQFVSLKEKYKLTPQMVADYVDSLEIKRTEKKYLNFVRIDQATSFDGFEGILFYATPDMLAGLCGWAFFDTNAADAVVSQFGSGCSTVVSMTVAENARQGYRCFLGLFDPSVRPYVGANELGFTIPMSRFRVMLETMKQCFLFDSHAWKKVKERLENK